MRQTAAARENAEIGRLEFQDDAQPSDALAGELLGDPLTQSERHLAQPPRRSGVLPEGGFGGDALDRAKRRHAAVVIAVGKACEAATELAEPSHQLLFREALQVGNGV